MGVKELWSVLTPHGQRKPICELRGKKVAIDLAGWVCESLNVVDYFVHPRHHLKNLFFRTCYLIWEQVTPVFVLEGAAPELKSKVIAKRNELQFRGVRPNQKNAQPSQPTGQSQGQGKAKGKGDGGRSRFNHVLKQCENLLLSMGVQCVQGPGEAEAYCAFLNKHGLVDGVISQDSDCFAYGAIRVYRNFSVSTQGTQAAAGGAVDIYDMRDICAHMDFGQHKVIVMALLCGCDYCPDGIGGIGKDGVLKLFKKYKETEILKRLRSWRSEQDSYHALELRVDDKTICSNCGHIGRTQSHTKNGCSVCRTHQGCDESLWKEQRLSIKAELMLRKKALTDVSFPNEEIISEFLSEPAKVPNLNLDWQQPNLVKFVKQIGHLLQWPEIYCVQKFFPILTRWQVQQQTFHKTCFLQPKEIIKKRVVKGVPSLEVAWDDTRNCLVGLIPQEQIDEFSLEHPKGIEELYYTIEPLEMLQEAFPDLVAAFLKSKEKPPKPAKKAGRKKNEKSDLDSENPNNVLKPNNRAPKQRQNTIDKFLKKNEAPAKEPPNEFSGPKVKQCSTPISKCLPSDLESDGEFDMSDIINGIISNPNALPTVTNHAGHLLHYKPLDDDLSLRLAQLSLHNDENLSEPPKDISFKLEKRQNNSVVKPISKRLSLDDSFDRLVKGEKNPNLAKTPLERFKQQHRLSSSKVKPLTPEPTTHNVSYFFNQSADEGDVFEQLMELSMVDMHQEEDLVVISDSD
ncbi:flap endonuclease GEN [Drosophila sulfurigaster albostrigata]|uniref:flap endonuclease GEN n=1 Tax=Drosophila sulfurigaster albostrigata TaxID=89887 RepID=UPI002D21E0D1|nr:flap endonuclease GEN [Drosophila sulfurigaster albostrigata]